MAVLTGTANSRQMHVSEPVSDDPRFWRQISRWRQPDSDICSRKRLSCYGFWFSFKIVGFVSLVLNSHLYRYISVLTHLIIWLIVFLTTGSYIVYCMHYFIVLSIKVCVAGSRHYSTR